MELKEYIEKGGQKLRLGYTTGSCAAAAAKAAALMLLTGETVPQVRLRTPRGTELYLEIEEICISEKAVSCAVRKDSGDDPDVTDGILVRAEVACSGIPGIRIDGGEGVGRVTRPGLDQPVGNAAINSTGLEAFINLVVSSILRHPVQFALVLNTKFFLDDLSPFLIVIFSNHVI